MRTTDLLGLLGHALLWAQLGLLVPGLRRRRGWERGAAMLLAAVLAWCPWGHGLCLAHMSRGILGDLSIACLVLLVFQSLRGVGLPLALPGRWRRGSAATVVLVLVLFYTSALGLWPADLYAGGYQPRALLVVLAVALAATWRWQRDLALALLAGLAGWECGLLESTNLWDYLADPILLIGACRELALAGRRARAIKAQASQPVPVPRDPLTQQAA